VEWFYLAASVAAIFTALQYFRALTDPGRLPKTRRGLAMLHSSGSVAELLVFVLLVGGAFFFSFWSAIVALAIGAAVAALIEGILPKTIPFGGILFLTLTSGALCALFAFDWWRTIPATP